MCPIDSWEKVQNRTVHIGWIEQSIFLFDLYLSLLVYLLFFVFFFLLFLSFCSKANCNVSFSNSNSNSSSLVLTHFLILMDVKRIDFYLLHYPLFLLLFLLLSESSYEVNKIYSCDIVVFIIWFNDLRVTYLYIYSSNINFYHVFFSSFKGS